MEENMKGLKLHCLYAYGCDMATMLGVNEVLKGFAKGDIANAPAIIRIIEKLKYFPRIPEIAEKLNKVILKMFSVDSFIFFLFLVKMNPSRSPRTAAVPTAIKPVST